LSLIASPNSVNTYVTSTRFLSVIRTNWIISPKWLGDRSIVFPNGVPNEANQNPIFPEILRLVRISSEVLVDDSVITT
jgi:hypothetical protein